MINVSLLQSQVALNRAVINDLHSRSWLFKDWADSEDCKVRESEFRKSAKEIAKKIAQYAKLQKALKKQIAEIVSAQRNPFAALHKRGFTAEEAAEYLENTDKTLFGYLKQPDGTFLASDLKKLKMELKGIL